MNIRERQSSRKYVLPPIPSSPLGNRTTVARANATNAIPPYGETRESTLRPGVRFRKTASSLRIIATKGNATLTAGLTYPKIHNPDLELYQKLKKREHEFAEAIAPAGAPFQYIPSAARDAELSAASARLYRPQTAQVPTVNTVDTKFDTFGNWYQDMKLKVHMRVVQSQQIISENSPLEEQPEPSPVSSSKSKKDKKKKDSYDAIEHTPQVLMTPKSKELKRERKMSLLSMKDILPSARDKNKKTAQAWEASRESWFAESTPHNSAPSTPKSRLTRASSFGSQSATPVHTYIPSSPADSPLRPRSRTQAPPRVINATPVNTSSAASSGISSSASSMASSVSTSPLSPSPTTTPTHGHMPPIYASSNNLPTATVTLMTSTNTASSPPQNPQLTQPVFLSRGKKMHSEYDIRKIRFKARNSVGLNGIVE